MPTYCFSNEKTGEVVDRFFNISDDIPRFITKDGLRYERDYAVEHAAVPTQKGWPIECYASGVNANQADDLREHFRKEGLNVEVSKDGNPIYSDMNQRRKALKSRGLVDKDSYI